MLKFGTSGLRGLVTEMDDATVYAYAHAFFHYCRSTGHLPQAGGACALAHDLRPSSPDIARAVVAAAETAGIRCHFWGVLPTPALAVAAMERDIPAVMVTGSHIPFDRNGIKFYLPSGEITKADEDGILDALKAAIPPLPAALPEPVDAGGEIRAAYKNRYLDFFPRGLLEGKRIGVYQHSSVSRDVLVEICTALGADVTALGRTDHFVPVDTEAVREEDVQQARAWAQQHRLDAVISTDGDGDRPLVFDAEGNCLRGDVIGLLTSRHLGAAHVVTPVTSTTAIERVGGFAHVERTQVGSPYVIAAMEKVLQAQSGTVMGFEANGGVLLGSAVQRHGRTLAALPTRDAVLPILCVFAEAFPQGKSLAQLAGEIPRITDSDRIRDIDRPRAEALLARLMADSAYKTQFFAPLGTLDNTCRIDGLRLTFTDGNIIHLRLSGNAPELRCYAESDDKAGAASLIRWGIERLNRQLSAE